MTAADGQGIWMNLGAEDSITPLAAFLGVSCWNLEAMHAFLPFSVITVIPKTSVDGDTR